MSSYPISSIIFWSYLISSYIIQSHIKFSYILLYCIISYLILYLYYIILHYITLNMRNGNGTGSWHSSVLKKWYIYTHIWNYIKYNCTFLFLQNNSASKSQNIHFPWHDNLNGASISVFQGATRLDKTWKLRHIPVQMQVLVNIWLPKFAELARFEQNWRCASTWYVARYPGSQPGINDKLQWRHIGRDSVSYHQPHNCVHNRLFRRRSQKTSKLRDRWPVRNGQLRGKCFHLMTSSWKNTWWYNPIRLSSTLIILRSCESVGCTAWGPATRNLDIFFVVNFKQFHKQFTGWYG